MKNYHHLVSRFGLATPSSTKGASEAGRSMIEMLGVLAIMGIITIGAITMISFAMRSQKRSAVQDDVVQMTTGVRQLLGEYDNFSGIDNSTIFAAIGMSDKGIYELAANPADPRQFIVSIKGLGESDCLFYRDKAWTDSVSGATAEPTNCTAAKNTIRITFGG